MSNAKKNRRNVTASMVGLIAFATVAIWQFYTFVTFEGAQGGSVHLWLAIALAVLACGMAFLVFFVFVQHDHADDLHITSTGRA